MGARKHRGVSSGSGEGHPVPNLVRVCQVSGLGGLAWVTQGHPVSRVSRESKGKAQGRLWMA